MLIASNFNDYFDSVSAFGVDKTCIYQRYTKELKGEFVFGDEVRKSLRSRWPHEDEFQSTKKGITTHWKAYKYVIGFCGKLYPMIRVEKRVGKEEKAEIFCCYSAEEVKKYFDKEKLKFASERVWFSFRDFSVRSEEAMKNFFEGPQFKSLEEEFHKNNCPIFVYGKFTDPEAKVNGKDRLILNPRLKDYRFMKVKDPQTAFQDVFMYIAGVLGTSEPKIIELSDKELAKKRGHDSPYSFRTPPKNKKGKRK
jgi:hypothetical protein